ncbi:MAG: hypothetical protein HGB15_08150 [Chlorobaculum sp.]|nr:hypothetical protein [Chlorobaculum sp.]
MLLQLLDILLGHAVRRVRNCGNLHLRAIGRNLEKLVVLHGALDLGKPVITPDGSRIISGSLDNTLKLWDADSGNCFMTMANLPDNETASWSETEPKLLSASPGAWRWIGLADGCRRLPIELLDDPSAP